MPQQALDSLMLSKPSKLFANIIVDVKIV